MPYMCPPRVQSPPPSSSLPRPLPCSARRRHTRCAAAYDALLIDAQNVLSRAGAEARRATAATRRPGEGVAGSFADWLRFLAAAAGEPQLMVAVFDAPASKRAPQQQRERLAPEYLQRRKRRQGGGEAPARPAPAAPSSSGGDPLRPFKQQVQQLGGVRLEAAAGWEADDGLAAACEAVRQAQPAASVLVASGDGDMQQLLGPQVTTAWAGRLSGQDGHFWCHAAGLLSSCWRLPVAQCAAIRPSACLQVAWLQLHGQASLSCPLGLQLVTAADFERQHSFPPAAYADWLALTGGWAFVGGRGLLPPPAHAPHGACCGSFASTAQPRPPRPASPCARQDGGEHPWRRCGGADCS